MLGYLGRGREGGEWGSSSRGERDGGKDLVCSLPLPSRIITPPEGQGGLEGVLPRVKEREGV